MATKKTWVEKLSGAVKKHLSKGKPVSKKRGIADQESIDRINRITERMVKQLTDEGIDEKDINKIFGKR